ncbi:MAG TPA: class I SAM-dependent methyltransferase [Dermatophilaceae bacterium]
MPRFHARIYPVLARELMLRPEDDLLEVACGSGVFLADQAQQVHRVAGLDLSGIQVDLARRRLADRIAAGTVEIVQGDAAALPWHDDTFSVVTCMGSFEAFPEPERVLAELVRVLRPGGRAVLNIGERVPPGTQTHQVLGAIWVWSEDDVRHMVEQAGLSDVQMSYASSSGDSRLIAMANRIASTFEAELRLVHGLRT